MKIYSIRIIVDIHGASDDGFKGFGSSDMTFPADHVEVPEALHMHLDAMVLACKAAIAKGSK